MIEIKEKDLKKVDFRFQVQIGKTWHTLNPAADSLFVSHNFRIAIATLPQIKCCGQNQNRFFVFWDNHDNIDDIAVCITCDEKHDLSNLS